MAHTTSQQLVSQSTTLTTVGCLSHESNRSNETTALAPHATSQSESMPRSALHPLTAHVVNCRQGHMQVQQHCRPNSNLRAAETAYTFVMQAAVAAATTTNQHRRVVTHVFTTSQLDGRGIKADAQGTQPCTGADCKPARGTRVVTDRLGCACCSTGAPHPL
jgi:hypothetical protein